VDLFPFFKRADCIKHPYFSLRSIVSKSFNSFNSFNTFTSFVLLVQSFINRSYHLSINFYLIPIKLYSLITIHNHKYPLRQHEVLHCNHPLPRRPHGRNPNSSKCRPPSRQRCLLYCCYKLKARCVQCQWLDWTLRSFCSQWL
jgi:hypothetical protein